jgi:hypothetical protein
MSSGPSSRRPASRPPPGAAFAALIELTGREMRLLGQLEAIRGPPQRARGRGEEPSLTRIANQNNVRLPVLNVPVMAVPKPFLMAASGV